MTWSLTFLAQTIASGLLLGGIYALLASSVTLIFGVMRVINFAQADFMMLGMFLAFALHYFFGLDPILIALPVGITLAMVGLPIAGVLERVPRGNQDAQLILTLGVSSVIQSLVLIFVGPTPKVVVRPYTNQYIELGGVLINDARLFAFIAAFVVMFSLYLFLTRTWIGRAMRATADDPNAAGSVGINVARIHIIAFVIGTGFDGFAGSLMVTFLAVTPTIGGDFIMIMFLAVVMGGLGSVPGAVLGGLLVGMIQSFGAQILTLQLQNVTLFVMFVVLLLVRPQGIFGFRLRA
jgi:branched-chain amino acid transport system permease protein